MFVAAFRSDSQTWLETPFSILSIVQGAATGRRNSGQTGSIFFFKRARDAYRGNAWGTSVRNPASGRSPNAKARSSRTALIEELAETRKSAGARSATPRCARGYKTQHRFSRSPSIPALTDLARETAPQTATRKKGPRVKE